jgi:hypothetical protein
MWEHRRLTTLWASAACYRILYPFFILPKVDWLVLASAVALVYFEIHTPCVPLLPFYSVLFNFNFTGNRSGSWIRKATGTKLRKEAGFHCLLGHRRGE